MPATAQQQVIIDHRDGPMIVLSGAGSGKTTTVIQRVASMMEEGHAARVFLNLTFSRKAAREMRERLHLILGEKDARVREVMIETFHAFAYRYVRAKPELCGRQAGLTVMDEAACKRAIRAVAESLGIEYNTRRKDIANWMSSYSYAKNEGVTAAAPGGMQELRRIMYEHGGFDPVSLDAAISFAQAYEDRMRSTNTCDFDDLCLLMLKALREHPGQARAIAERFRYITVDESQDTNRVQYELLDAIARHHRNIVMCGDDDQSVYGWRGARVENMFQFVREYRPVEARLERNFRSTPAIVAAAARHIAHNESRLAKKPYAEGDAGTPPQLLVHGDSRQMARSIATEIRKSLDAGADPSSICVMYRTNRMARLLEGDLSALRIPYRVVGGRSIYDAPEARAALAAARLIVNPRDEQALKELMPYLPGLGEKSIQKIVDEMLFINSTTDRSVDLFTAAHSLGGKLWEGMQWLDDRLTALEEMGACRAGEWVAYERGLNLINELREKERSGSGFKQGEADRRQATLEAIDQATFASVSYAHQVSTPEEYCALKLAKQQHFAPLLEAGIGYQEPESSGSGAVTLTTIHRAKGLEWDQVHVAGYSQGLLPLDPRQAEDDDDCAGAHAQEERRLSYVAVTRAKRVCRLHHASIMYFPGAAPAKFMPSVFLEEMGIKPQAEALDGTRDDELGHGFSHQSGGQFSRALSRMASPRF